MLGLAETSSSISLTLTLNSSVLGNSHFLAECAGTDDLVFDGKGGARALLRGLGGFGEG